MPVPAKLQEFLDELEFFLDRKHRIELLIGLGDRYQPLDESIATRPYPDANRVPGCESQVYVWGTPRSDGTLDYHFAVENPQGISAMALAVLLQDTASGAPLEEVVEISDQLVLDVFGNELSMGKNMGLTGMVHAVRNLARNAMEQRVSD
jgi:cysteine desulfuration protein SufE